MKTNLEINWEAVNRLVEEGYISQQRHPDRALIIYNYTHKCQYEWKWTAETMACRGLIVNHQREIVSRPFPKFFSIEQRTEPLPIEPFQVFEKLDGSLGIGYTVDGRPAIATRGSFTSDQAAWATEFLRTQYPDLLFLDGRTYLFEIIYKGNRIVVDYGDFEGLILLALIDNETGADLELPEIGIPIVKRYDGINDIDQLATLEEPNKEGFVLLFKSGLRVKAKFAEYKRLHRILTGLTARNIWEALQTPNGLEVFLERVPDEFYAWVKVIESDLLAGYSAIENQCRAEFKNLGDRKTTAKYFQRCQYPAVLFKMLDGRDYSDLIWKRIYPGPSKAFREDES